MTEGITQDQLMGAVAGLSPDRLAAFQEAELVTRHPSIEGPVFGPRDVARLTLLCDLANQFDLEGDALAVVIGLIEQLHRARARLHAMAQAIEPEPQDLRQRVGARFVAILAV